MHCRTQTPIVSLSLSLLVACSGGSDKPQKLAPADAPGSDTDTTQHGDAALNTTDHDITGSWMCSPTYQTDATCDCGCGVIDTAACTVGCAEPNCTAIDCDYCYNANHEMTPCTPPAEWTCAADTWTDANCDCGCGILDHSCDLGGCAEASCAVQGCQACHDASGATITCAPEGWLCNPAFYTDNSCDCGCGLADLACDGAGCTTPGCSDAACEWCYDGNQSNECTQG